MRRILFITSRPYYPWEGVCHRTRNTLEAIVSSDYAVDVLTTSLHHAPEVAGVNTLCVPHLPFCENLPEGPSVRRFALDLLMLFKAVFLAGRTPYALIHGTDDCGVIAWIAGRLTKTPCVFERHMTSGYDSIRGPRRFWLGTHRFLERCALRRSDAIIGNDTAIVALLSSFGRRSRACVIPDIPTLNEEVPVPARNLAQARYKTSADQKLVACVASYTRFQGLDLFFNAMPRVLAAYPNVHFVVVGGNENEIQRMRKTLSKAHIEDAVSFPGRISHGELAALLSVSDLLVSPRCAGNTAPIKVLDYLYSCTPVVAADTPANRTVLSPDNALITRPTPEGLADGILKLCRSPHIGEELSRCGRDTLIQENRTPEAFRTALCRCYDYVIAGTAK